MVPPLHVCAHPDALAHPAEPTMPWEAAPPPLVMDMREVMDGCNTRRAPAQGCTCEQSSFGKKAPSEM